MYAPTGELTRETVPGLWRALPASADGVDLAGTQRIDSAGVAFLACVLARWPQARLENAPAELEALRQAYRLDARLEVGN